MRIAARDVVVVPLVGHERVVGDLDPILRGRPVGGRRVRCLGVLCRQLISGGLRLLQVKTLLQQGRVLATRCGGVLPVVSLDRLASSGLCSGHPSSPSPCHILPYPCPSTQNCAHNHLMLARSSCFLELSTLWGLAALCSHLNPLHKSPSYLGHHLVHPFPCLDLHPFHHGSAAYCHKCLVHPYHTVAEAVLSHHTGL